MSTDLIPFDEYQALVESCTLADKRGVWHIALSDMAKAPGDWVMEYHYRVYREHPDGTRVVVTVFPPARLRVIAPDDNVFDARIQISHEELMDMLHTAKEQLAWHSGG